ncbi:MAG: hypothetical protein PHE29_15165 [Tissierellia bacterium]|nr:hypothetical protein [Tissierellia bacterium]MDY0143742.1 hypothetical protein [Bacteroidales bacterium]
MLIENLYFLYSIIILLLVVLLFLRNRNIEITNAKNKLTQEYNKNIDEKNKKITEYSSINTNNNKIISNLEQIIKNKENLENQLNQIENECENLSKQNDLYKNSITDKDSKLNELNIINNQQLDWINQHSEQTNQLEETLNEKIKLENILKEKDDLYLKLQEINDVNLKKIAILYADYITLQFDITDKYYRQTYSKINEQNVIKVRDLKKITKEYVEKYKLLLYKYEYLLSLFPELEIYTDNITSLVDYNNEIKRNLSEVREEFDNSLFYLSKEEYIKMSEVDRNQLALDRYVAGRKTNWQIGRDYEMYIGYVYEKQGYEVEYIGIERSLNDLGRDLIVRESSTIKIIQCKYWSQDKLIREKHIAQLYGTTIQFLLSNKTKINVVPVLITNIRLSDTAKLFADYLQVEYIENMALGEYPRIKCNTNKDELGVETRIYHLPFDQQYDRTKISRKGDLYALTVKEAIDKGFRRAKRFYGLK